MKLFCKENHWNVKDGKLLLDTPTGKQDETAMRMVAVIEAKVRLQIYDEICAMKFSDNRKALMKVGLDNVALTVQAMCADVALGKKNG